MNNNNIIVATIAWAMEAIEMSKVLPMAHLLGLNSNLALLGCLMAFLGLGLFVLGMWAARKNELFFVPCAAAGFACILTPIGVKLLNDSCNLW